MVWAPALPFFSYVSLDLIMLSELTFLVFKMKKDVDAFPVWLKGGGGSLPVYLTNEHGAPTVWAPPPV